MLDIKNIISALILGFIAWVGASIIDLRTNTAVIAVKVDENHQMLSVLWEDFLREKNNGNLAWFHENADINPASEKKDD